MIGSTISHYRILEELGRGGMGVVYKAEDTRLKRTVALKFLPAALTRDPEAKARFLHEAQTASSLQHAAICTVHDADETDDGQVFMVMDCYEGETLSERLRGGPLALDRALDIFCQVADGLRKAHEKGIIHRDLKPANVFLTADGPAKILDFGLAKLAGQTKLTREGTTLGTVAYMSPEQARGETVDHRSDIWSLGVILFEMVTGRLPFQGDYDQAVIYAILNETPAHPSTLQPDVPEAIERIIAGCLQKDPSDRVQDISALLEDLESLRHGTLSSISTPRPRPRIGRTKSKRRSILAGAALLGILVVVTGVLLWRTGKGNPDSHAARLVVLPFDNVGPPENEYFTDGMTDELTTRLASLSELRVISRTSAFVYANTDKGIDRIGKELDVGYALSGSVRWAQTQDGSSRIRISPSLTRIADKTILWAETYDVVIDDVFQAQTEIAQRVVENLGITLFAPDRKAVETAPTQNLEAYQAFLRARYFERRPHFTAENWLQAVEAYRKATELDPGFALAFAELSKAHARLHYHYYDHSDERLEMAKRAAEQAKRLSPDVPAVHLALGYYRLYAERDTDAAREEFASAERGMPRNVDVYRAKAAAAMIDGDWTEGMINSREAFRLSPRDPAVALDLAECFWLLRRFEEAVDISDRAIELAPEDAWPYLYKAFALLGGRGAVAETRAVLDMVPKEHSWAPLVMYWQDFYERKYENAIENLTANARGGWIRTKVWAMPISLQNAYAYRLMGQMEKAREEYEAARIALEEAVRKSPDDQRYHGSLGIAYAGLDRKVEAVREGTLAASLLPMEMDAMYGIRPLQDLAQIYTLLGDVDSAVAQLDVLLSRPTWLAVEWIKVDPTWDDIRGTPQFEALLKKHESPRK